MRGTSGVESEKTASVVEPGHPPGQVDASSHLRTAAHAEFLLPPHSHLSQLFITPLLSLPSRDSFQLQLPLLIT